MRTKQKVAGNRNQTHKMNEGGVLVVEKKTIEYYMALPYQEVIVAAKEGGYVGYIPELKGCITQSETKAGILDMLEDAKACWLEAALEEGIEIPEPQDESEYS